MKKMVGCRFCNNARVDASLLYDEDYSAISVGQSFEGIQIELVSGFGLPLRLEVSEWDGTIMVMQGRYVPNYCPECGRKIVEYPEWRKKAREVVQL